MASWEDWTHVCIDLYCIHVRGQLWLESWEVLPQNSRLTQAPSLYVPIGIDEVDLFANGCGS